MPSTVPQPNPTAQPTVTPTPYPSIIILPGELTLRAEKPARQLTTLTLVNLETTQMQYKITMNATASVFNESHGGLSIEPRNGTVRSLSSLPIAIAVNTTGVAGGQYELSLEVTSSAVDADEMRRIVNIVPFSLTIIARASSFHTEVIIDGAPTLDTQWTGLSLAPRDSDGYAISVDTEEDFAVTLACNYSSSIFSTACDVVWFRTAARYRAECRVANILMAGEWKLNVFLNDGLIHSSGIQMKCPHGTIALDFKPPIFTYR